MSEQSEGPSHHRENYQGVRQSKLDLNSSIPHLCDAYDGFPLSLPTSFDVQIELFPHPMNANDGGGGAQNP